MTEDDISEVVTIVSQDPHAGVVIKGTGGCRKLRIAGKGRGKSGGYRTITFFGGDELPVFLITVFSKGEKVNLSQKERNALVGMTRQIITAYEMKIIRIGTGT